MDYIAGKMHGYFCGNNCELLGGFKKNFQKK